jgi:alkylation response protein AidB-like acyl-CoA dehydrogenase
MDLELTESQLAFRDDFRSFLGRVLTQQFSDDFEGQRAWQRLLHSERWVAPHWPAEYGGRDASIAEFAIWVTELGRARAPQLANRVGMQTAGPMLIAHGNNEQRARYLPLIPSADEIWCQLFSEPGAGSDLAGLTTTARLDGDVWRVTGQKVWTSYGAQADFGPMHRGISCFICDMHAPGVDPRPLRTITGDSEFAEVFLDDAPLPANALIGKRGEGWSVANTGLGSERGLAFPLKEQAALAILLDELLDGVRDGSITPSPVQRDRLARDIVNAHVFRLTNLRTVSELSQGRELGSWPSVVKLTWEETAQHLAETVFTLTGARDSRTEQQRGGDLLHYRMASIAAGTTQIQRNIIGEQRLGLPREPRRTKEVR